MFINNNYIKSNFVSFFDNFIIVSFIKTILINKTLKNQKKIITIFKKKKKKLKNYFFGFLFKKIKFGYFINETKFIFLPNNLIDTRKIIFPKKIFFFEIILKKIQIENNYFATRKFNFKKKKKISRIKIGKKYLGIIKNVINYGIFINIGEFDGLLHISDIPFIKNIYKSFFIKNFLIVKIIKFDRKLKKVSLNLKKNYKKNFEKFFFSEKIKCFIKKFSFKKIICYNNISKKYIIFDKLNEFKKKDIINAYFLKKTEKQIYLSMKFTVKKNNFKYSLLMKKYKFKNYYLLSYKKNNILYKKLIKKIKITKIEYYKYYLINIINNEFNKIININNNYYLKQNNFYIRIKNKLKKKVNIFNLKYIKNKIYFFFRIY
ncbi:S1 RNA-binding domain-containing protein [Candidatus Carsonella ruddii]|uniref:30S ribosomal protein S1 n=1 Tax=Candidatus Carsonella ruddii (Diaphorina cf. continua) TaxID=2661587 RepID=A0A7R7ABH3_CARRU|nr:S1 RNA-binding domain-containing protein [Candidatus Carsonella ruddii (Diaphorina cf. continua)]BCG49278.1 30S ribosomal protein S1 [Candidatus Carsonella ruddii (Diaphorina cf. continua)]